MHISPVSDLDAVSKVGVGPVPPLRPTWRATMSMVTETGINPVYNVAPAKSAQRKVEFFTTQINNDRTRKAYLNATRRFSAWSEMRGLSQRAGVQPIHVGALSQSGRPCNKPAKGFQASPSISPRSR